MIWLRREWPSVLLGIVLAWLCSKTLISSWHLALFTADSWGYNELAQHVFSTDPFTTNNTRNFVLPTGHNSSFGPLWPLVIACWQWLPVSIGHLQLLLTTVSVLAIAAGGEGWARKHQRPGIGLLAACGLMLFPPFVDEVASGRSIPLAVALVAAILWWSARTTWTIKQAVILGVLAAALTLTRNELLLVAVALPLITGIWRQRQILVAMSITFIACLLPWIAYSLIHFHQLFASDNSILAKTSRPHYILDWFPHEQTALQNPSSWFARIGDNWTTMINGLPGVFLGAGACVVVVVVVVCLTRFQLLPSLLSKIGAFVGSLIVIDVATGDPFGFPGFEDIAIKAIILSACILAVVGATRNSFRRLPSRLFIVTLLATMTAPLLLAYVDQRYWSAPLWLLTILLLSYGAVTAQGAIWLVRCSSVIAVALAIWTLPTVDDFFVVRHPHSLAALNATNVQQLAACSHQQRILVEDSTMAAYIPALSNTKTTMFPSNWSTLTASQRQSLLTHYPVKLFYGNKSTAAGVAGAMQATVVATGCFPNLWRLQPMRKTVPRPTPTPILQP